MGGWGFLDNLRRLWMEHGITITISKKFEFTGYRKPKPMIFKRPVADEFKVSAPFGEWGALWSKHMSTTGAWVEGQLNGKGQHKGIDFAVPENTLVLAMYDGIIVRSGWENINNPKQGFGLRVRQEITTPDGISMTLVYGHLSLLYPREGHQIVAGDRIGLSGRSGHVSGPHLHIELIDNKAQYHPIVFAPPVEKPLVNQPDLA